MKDLIHTIKNGKTIIHITQRNIILNHVDIFLIQKYTNLGHKLLIKLNQFIIQ